jgi:tetratricopeptide (TPR) repeat protein
MLGDYHTAVPVADEGLALWQVLGDAHGSAVALVRRGQIAQGLGDYQLATALLVEARALFRELDGPSGPEVPTAGWLAEVVQAQGDHDWAEHLWDEVRTEARSYGDGHAVAHALRELARLRRTQGETEQALSLLRESATLHLPLKDIRCASILLEDLGGVLCERGRPIHAARLFAAADGFREVTGKPLTKAQMLTHDRDLASVKQQLAPEDFAAGWAEGRAMTLEQAIVYALDASAPV